MLKRFGIPALALIALLVMLTPAPAKAGVLCRRRRRRRIPPIRMLIRILTHTRTRIRIRTLTIIRIQVIGTAILTGIGARGVTAVTDTTADEAITRAECIAVVARSVAAEGSAAVAVMAAVANAQNRWPQIHADRRG